MSIEGLKDQIMQLKRTKPVKPIKPEWIVDDATHEALTNRISSNRGVATLMSDEGGTILNGRGFQNIPLLNKCWSGSMISILRKASPSFTVDNPRLTISIMSQPSEMDKFMKKRGSTAQGAGFLSRFLICTPQSTQGIRYLEGE